MSDTQFFHTRLTEAETSLTNRRQQRAALDHEIDTLETVIQL
jgi:hypothetical protein